MFRERLADYADRSGAAAGDADETLTLKGTAASIGAGVQAAAGDGAPARKCAGETIQALPDAGRPSPVIAGWRPGFRRDDLRTSGSSRHGQSRPCSNGLQPNSQTPMRKPDTAEQLQLTQERVWRRN
jgi:hypothetical protein